MCCSVQEHDSGSYFCRASNTHLQRFLSSRRAALTVLGMRLDPIPDTEPSLTSTITFLTLPSSWQPLRR